MADDISAERSVTRFLQLVKQEFPDYMTDNDQMVAAALCLAHAAGAVGAVVLIKGSEERLDKMIRMFAKNIDDTAHKGAQAARDGSLKRLVS